MTGAEYAAATAVLDGAERHAVASWILTGRDPTGGHVLVLDRSYLLLRAGLLADLPAEPTARVTYAHERIVPLLTCPSPPGFAYLLVLPATWPCDGRHPDAPAGAHTHPGFLLYGQTRDGFVFARDILLHEEHGPSGGFASTRRVRGVGMCETWITTLWDAVTTPPETVH